MRFWAVPFCDACFWPLCMCFWKSVRLRHTLSSWERTLQNSLVLGVSLLMDCVNLVFRERCLNLKWDFVRCTPIYTWLRRTWVLSDLQPFQQWYRDKNSSWIWCLQKHKQGYEVCLPKPSSSYDKRIPFDWVKSSLELKLFRNFLSPSSIVDHYTEPECNNLLRFYKREDVTKRNSVPVLCCKMSNFLRMTRWISFLTTYSSWETVRGYMLRPFRPRARQARMCQEQTT